MIFEAHEPRYHERSGILQVPADGSGTFDCDGTIPASGVGVPLTPALSPPGKKGRRSDDITHSADIDFVGAEQQEPPVRQQDLKSQISNPQSGILSRLS